MVTVTASGLGTVLMETLMTFASGPLLVAPTGIGPGQVVRSLVYSSVRMASVIEGSRPLKVMTRLMGAHARVLLKAPIRVQRLMRRAGSGAGKRNRAARGNPYHTPPG